MQTVVESSLCSAYQIALLAFLKSIYSLLCCWIASAQIKILDGFYIKMLQFIIQ